MSCENIQQYDFCTIKDHTVPKWLISSALFTNDMTLKISIYNQFGTEIQVITPETLDKKHFEVFEPREGILKHL